MKAHVLIATVLLSLCSFGISQSPFSDARGKSSIIIPGGGYGELSFEKASARIGFFQDYGKMAFYGFELSAKPQGDSATFFRDGNLISDAAIKLSYGTRLQKSADRQEQASRDWSFGLAEEYDIATADLEEFVERRQAIVDETAELEAAIKNLKIKLDAEVNPMIRERLQADIMDKQRRLGVITEPQFREELEANITDAKKHIKELNKRVNAIGGRMAFETVTFQIEATAAKYKLFDDTQPFESQFSERQFQGWGASLIYNGLLPNVRYGISVGFERSNNSEDLKAVEVTETKTFEEGGIERTTTKRVSALVGVYKKLDRIPLRMDLISWPRQLRGRIGINLFARMDLKESDSFMPGIGVFLSKPGAPTAVVGGLSVLFDKGKPKAAIVAGYSF